MQLFQKFPLLIAAAPTQQAPAFIVTQLIVLVMFVQLGRAATRGFVTGSASAAPPGGAVPAT